MAFDAATLAAMKVDYEESHLTLVAMGEKYSCSPSYISRLAREHGWVLRTHRLGRTSRLKPPPGLQACGAIGRRLGDIINRKLEQMEKDMQSGELSSTDLERDAKTIGTMIGGMEKAVRTADEDKQREPQDAKAASAENAPNAGGNADEVARLQREIVERFERIKRRREAEGGSQ